MSDPELIPYRIRSHSIRPAFMCVLAIVIAMVGLANVDALSWDISGDAIALYALIAIAGLAALWNAATLFLRLPQIALDETGFSHATLWCRRAWRWRDAGPFSVSVYRRGRGGRDYYACAYLDRHHALLAAHGKAREPTYVDADIRIPLDGLNAGTSEDHAAAFVAELNQWRARYGTAPADRGNPGSRDVADELDHRLLRSRLAGWVPALLVIVVVALVLLTRG